MSGCEPEPVPPVVQLGGMAVARAAATATLTVTPPPWWRGPLDRCLYQFARFVRWITGGMLWDWLTGTPAYRTAASHRTGA